MDDTMMEDINQALHDSLDAQEKLDTHEAAIEHHEKLKDLWETVVGERNKLLEMMEGVAKQAEALTEAINEAESEDDD